MSEEGSAGGQRLALELDNFKVVSEGDGSPLKVQNLVHGTEVELGAARDVVASLFMEVMSLGEDLDELRAAFDEECRRSRRILTAWQEDAEQRANDGARADLRAAELAKQLARDEAAHLPTRVDEELAGELGLQCGYGRVSPQRASELAARSHLDGTAHHLGVDKAADARLAEEFALPGTEAAKKLLNDAGDA